MDQLDPALDLGWTTVKGLQLLSRALSHHRRGNHPCHLCDVAPPPKLSVLGHTHPGLTLGRASSRSLAGLQKFEKLIRKTPFSCLV